MAKVYFDFKLHVAFMKEGNRFIAYSSALDLSTSGKTHEEARRRFGEAVVLFFRELYKRNTAGEVLKELGWQQVKSGWRPPVFIGQELEPIRVPLPV